MAISKKVLNAALNGPQQLKGVEINGHEFNVKPVSYRTVGDEITVFGQISHCLKFRKDDQVWFTFRKNGKKVEPNDSIKMIVEKEDGGVFATISLLKPAGVVVGSLFGVDAGKFFDLLNKASNSSSFIDFDQGWEKAVSGYLQELSANVVKPKRVINPGVQLFQDPHFTGRSLLIKVDQDVENTKNINFNDNVTSILAKVPAGKKVSIFQHADFKGLALEFGVGEHRISNLETHKLNDEISSIKWENV